MIDCCPCTNNMGRTIHLVPLLELGADVKVSFLHNSF